MNQEGMDGGMCMYKSFVDIACNARMRAVFVFKGGVFKELPVVGVRLCAKVLVVFSAVTRTRGVGFAS